MSHYSGWGFDWEDRVITIQGNKVKIETQLSEFVDEVLAQRHALTLARTVKSNTPIMLKITCEYVYAQSNMFYTFYTMS